MSANEPKFTQGPWAWMGNSPHNIYLATTHSGRRYVMGFRRWGFNSAQPVFQENSRLVDASTLLQFEVGDNGVIGYEAARKDESVYRYDISGIASADARLIAMAPELYEALEVAIFCMVANEKIKNPEWDGSATPTSVIGKARAILAKAKGEVITVAAAPTIFDEMIANPPFNPTEHEQTK